MLTLFFIAARAQEKPEEQFKCEDGSTIKKKYRCDKIPDCPDESDEQNCTPGKLKLVNNSDEFELEFSSRAGTLQFSS